MRTDKTSAALTSPTTNVKVSSPVTDSDGSSSPTTTKKSSTKYLTEKRTQTTPKTALVKPYDVEQPMRAMHISEVDSDPMKRDQHSHGKKAFRTTDVTDAEHAQSSSSQRHPSIRYSNPPVTPFPECVSESDSKSATFSPGGRNNPSPTTNKYRLQTRSRPSPHLTTPNVPLIGPSPHLHSQHAPTARFTPRNSYEQQTILFYDKHDPYYEFTNFSSYPVEYKGKRYPTSEHLFQSFKFHNYKPGLAEHIRTCSERPSVAFSEARRFQPEVRPDWSQINIEKMEEALWHKFTQHPDLRAELLSTGNAKLVEASDKDAFWGWGPDHHGRNELGKALERLRAKLRGGRGT